MAREKFKTLTEQMFYVLLCLREVRCSIDILSWIPEITGGRGTVGSGTLYNLLETFLEEGMSRKPKWKAESAAICCPPRDCRCCHVNMKKPIRKWRITAA